MDTWTRTPNDASPPVATPADPFATLQDTQAKSDAEHCSACARYFVELCYKFQVRVGRIAPASKLLLDTAGLKAYICT